MIELLALSFVIMLASLTGAITLWGRAGHFVERNLDYLVSFSAGVFLIFLYGLAAEAIEHAESTTAGMFWILAGAVGLWLTFKLLPSAHVHVHEHEGQRVKLDPRRIVTTDAIHNMADGIFLAATYAVSPLFAALAAVSIFIHEALQEVSEFFVLRDGGYSTKQALMINFAVSSTILIGSIGGYFLLDLFEVIESPLLGLAAGGLLVVVLLDLIPHSLRGVQSRSHALKHLAWFAVGMALMFVVSSLGGH